MDNKDTESMVGGVENKGLLSFDISSVKGHTFAVVHASCQNEEFKADTHNLSRSFFEEGATTNLGSSNLEEAESSSSEEEVASSVPLLLRGGLYYKPSTCLFFSEEGSTTNLGSSSSKVEVASSVVAPEYTSHSTGTIPVMDNKDTKSILGGVESERPFSSDISSVKGHTSAVVHASGQDEEFKADTHNLSRSSSEEGSTTNLDNSSSEEVASSMVARKYNSHNTGTVLVMDNKDTKSNVGGVENEGLFSSDFSSMKGHTSAAVHAPGQHEEFKVNMHNFSRSSSEEGSTTNVGSSSSEEEVASSVVAPLYSASAPEFLWSEVRPLDPSRAETGNEEESFRLVRRIHPSELRVVRKISKGGQGEILFAWLEHKPVVVKRYKDPNVSVADLQRQMEMVMKACEGRSESGLCKVIGVSRDQNRKTLLVMQLMKGDLRNLIDSKKLLLDSGIRDIMRGIARGLKNLHACGRIHKDVKASNILVNTRESEPIPIPPTGRDRRKDWWDLPPHLPQFDDLGRVISYCTYTHVDAYIGDYESVDGVDGTGFWRPPEVLKALKYGTPEDLKLAYSPAVDVYGFGMVLYELLTGRIPLEGHSRSDYDFVISGHRPDIPDDVSAEMRDLLLRCWHEDPHQRPTWTEIEKYF